MHGILFVLIKNVAGGLAAYVLKNINSSREASEPGSGKLIPVARPGSNQCD